MSDLLSNYEPFQLPLSVTVTMTCYNHEKYIRQAIESVLKQRTSFPVYLVIHDDASTDGSAAIIREYAEQYPEQISAILQTENQHQQGKSIAKLLHRKIYGRYFARCECDDYWIDDLKLQKQVDYMETNPDCILLYTNILPVNKNGQHDETLRGLYLKLSEGDYNKKEIKSGMLKTQTATILGRNIFPYMSADKCSFYYNARFNGDQKVLVTFGRLGRVHYLSDTTAAHRRVFDEGDSYTARLARKSNYEVLVIQSVQFLEMCDYIQKMFNESCYCWNQLLLNDLKSKIFYNKSLFSASEIQKYCMRRDVPVASYFAFPFYLIKRVIQKMLK